MTYGQNAFHAAVSPYHDKTMSSVEATKKFEVPENATRKHKNQANDRVGSGHPFLPSNEQEKYLLVLLKELESIGVQLTPSNFI